MSNYSEFLKSVLFEKRTRDKVAAN